ncbi:hypothetical protein AB6D07_22835, partial [Vibrio sp. 10N.239.312.C11]
NTRNGVVLSLNLITQQSLYPKLFNEKSVQKLSQILADGFLIEGKVNNSYLNPDEIQKIIGNL